MKFSLLINIVGIFILFISRENFMLNSVEHEIFSANKYHNVNSVEHEIKFCNLWTREHINLCPAIWSIVSLTSCQNVNCSIKYNNYLIHRYFCWKNTSSLFLQICESYSHFFSKNINVYAIFNDKSSNHTLTNDIISFEQLSPDLWHDPVILVLS